MSSPGLGRQVAVRLSEEQIRVLDALVEPLRIRYPWMRASRSAVVRLAIVEGLRVLARKERVRPMRSVEERKTG